MTSSQRRGLGVVLLVLVMCVGGWMVVSWMEGKGSRYGGSGVMQKYGVALSAYVDVNKAGEGELAALPGVGAKLAGEILKYRKQKLESGRGGIETIEELLEVKGMGPEKLEKIRGHLVIGKGE